ncbi:T9SS type A sorting domain-containing protein [Membranihabitans maritimus]|uniref:T9SS type A sorting domain-containing protein n=1 Tax=Membranihabitans maritimus TaxID=2904244 RepID=UPI001F43F7BB|nr:T9SS type A sorting domain-containing protein [Membranihabitans maritimus]
MRHLKSNINSAMKVIIIPVLWVLFLIDFAFGQENISLDNEVCGTQDLSEYISGLETTNTIKTRANTVLFYPIKVFSVGNDNGDGHMNALDIRESLCTLNEDFSSLNIQFYLSGEISRINNDDYYEHDLSDGYEMMRNFNNRNAFNIYIVESPNGNCGYFNTSNPAVAVSKDCFAGGTHTLTHEMGHFFGLSHTFYGWENRTYNADNVPRTLRIRGRDTLYTETVAGKHCENASDGFCDTPPDYISERWNCDQDGLSLDSYIDPNGEEFKVDAKNFMSYSFNRCQEYFSEEQKAEMLSILEGEYENLQYEFVPGETLSGDIINAISPDENSDINYDQVRLQWEPIPGVQEYIIQISRFNGVLFNNGLTVNLTTDGNQVDVDPNDLRLDTRYYWRIVPVNSFTFCTEPSQEYSFITREQTNIHQLPDGDKINIFPNILSSGEQFINIKYELNSTKEFDLQLFDLQGKLLQSKSEKITGDFHSRLEVYDLSSGMYVLTIRNGNKVISERIIVQ